MADFELGISIETVVGLIDLAREGEELDEEATGEDMQEKETPEDDPENISAALPGMIADLNTDEQAALIALTWVGRGDYTAEEWPQALRLARERNADGSAPTYLAGTEMLGDLLSEGLAAMGMPAEEEPR
jgi:hypothetical protein